FFFRAFLRVVHNFLANLQEIGFRFFAVLLALNRFLKAFKSFSESSEIIELSSLPVVIVIRLVGGGAFVIGPSHDRQRHENSDESATHRIHSPLPGVPFKVTTIARPRFSAEAGPKTVIWEAGIKSFALKYFTSVASRERPRSISAS